MADYDNAVLVVVDQISRYIIIVPLFGIKLLNVVLIDIAIVLCENM